MKFNKATSSVPAIVNNIGGGQGIALTKKEELVGIVLNSFVSDGFYESVNDTLKRLEGLVKDVPIEFAAKAAIYSRTFFGMRSISHYLAAIIALDVRSKGQIWSSAFFDKIVYRVDDMAEILSVIWNKNERLKRSSGKNKIPTHVKKGFRKAFNRFDDYQLSKYKMEGKDINLFDLVRLLHPTWTDRNRKTLESIAKGVKIVNQTTSSNVLTKIGQEAETVEERDALRGEFWKTSIENKTLGMTDLVRSLTKIVAEADKNTINTVANIISDKQKVSNGKIFPFQLYLAQKMVQSVNGYNGKVIHEALEKAIANSVANIPEYDGNTCIVVDHSGSMDSSMNSNNKLQMFEAAMVFGISLARKTNADVIVFGDNASYYKFNPFDSLPTIIRNTPYTGSGTNISSCFIAMNKAYNRIFFFSDLGHNNSYDREVWQYAANYKKKYNVNSHVYYVDLTGNKAVPSKDSNSHYLAGISDKVFELIPKFETDKQALINTIEAVTFDVTVKVNKKPVEVEQPSAPVRTLSDILTATNAPKVAKKKTSKVKNLSV